MLPPGTIVWAKFDDYPYWPARITSREIAEKLKEHHGRDGIGVLFFGIDLTYALVDSSLVKPFSEYFMMHVNGCHSADFNLAVDQALKNNVGDPFLELEVVSDVKEINDNADANKNVEDNTDVKEIDGNTDVKEINDNADANKNKNADANKNKNADANKNKNADANKNAEYKNKRDEKVVKDDIDVDNEIDKNKNNVKNIINSRNINVSRNGSKKFYFSESFNPTRVPEIKNRLYKIKATSDKMKKKIIKAVDINLDSIFKNSIAMSDIKYKEGLNNSMGDVERVICITENMKCVKNNKLKRELKAPEYEMANGMNEGLRNELKGEKTIFEEELRSKVHDELNGELKNELKEELKNELKEELKNELEGVLNIFKEEFKNELEGVLNISKEELKNELEGVLNIFKEKLRSEVESELKGGKMMEVKNEVNNFKKEIKAKIEDLRKGIGNAIMNEFKGELNSRFNNFEENFRSEINNYKKESTKEKKVAAINGIRWVLTKLLENLNVGVKDDDENVDIFCEPTPRPEESISKSLLKLSGEEGAQKIDPSKEEDKLIIRFEKLLKYYPMYSEKLKEIFQRLKKDESWFLTRIKKIFKHKKVWFDPLDVYKELIG